MKVGPYESGRVYEGDCLEMMDAIPGNELSCIVTDPPYGMGFRSNYRDAKYSPIRGDDDGYALVWACSLKATHSSYVFCRWDNLRNVPPPKSAITWVKNNWGMGDLEHEHARQTEMILFYPGPGHRFPNGRPQDIVYSPRTGNEMHPTQKPVSLMKEVIGWTRGLVIDPFAGSGSTGIACAEKGRDFIGFEIDPDYCRLANDRIVAARKGITLKEHRAGQKTLFDIP